MATNRDNVQRFQSLLRAAIQRVPDQAGVIIRKVALQAVQGVVQMSPVDTGRFRGAWQLQVGGPPSGEGTPDRGGQATVARAEAALARMQGAQSVWITNTVPYAQELEDGHSPQAPAGVLGVTAARLSAQFTRVTI